MDLLKKSPAQIALAVIGLIVLVVLILLFGKIRGFEDQFAYIAPPPNNKVETLDTTALTIAQGDFDKPPRLTPQTAAGAKEPGSLFVADLYVKKNGQLIKIDRDGVPLHPPISNAWLRDADIDLTSTTVPAEDPDRDGFTNLDEWNGMDGISHLDNTGKPAVDSTGKQLEDDSTDPTDAKSHPGYLTKVVLLRVQKKAFRLILKAWNEDRTKPGDFQLNTLDVNNPSLFLSLGDEIPKTKYKLEKFEFKEVKGADGTMQDVSVLYVLNTETQILVPLVLGKVTDSPESFAVLAYKWVKPGTTDVTKDFAVKVNQEFGVQPESDKKYKLIDIKDTEVQIQTPTGEKKTFRQTQ